MASWIARHLRPLSACAKQVLGRLQLCEGFLVSPSAEMLHASQVVSHHLIQGCMWSAQALKASQKLHVGVATFSVKRKACEKWFHSQLP